MSGLFCDTCGYERPGCSCDDPFFHKHAMELKAQRKAVIAEIRKRVSRNDTDYIERSYIPLKDLETILTELEK